MSSRPALAAKIAHCIAVWAEIETLLGVFLAMLLHANERAALSMYSAVENRAAQTRMILAAAKATLEDSHFNIISALMASVVTPAMKDRDKLAHWCWGMTEELPDALLITEPKYKLGALLNSVHVQAKTKASNPQIPFEHDQIYVLRDGDLDRMLKRFYAVEETLRTAMGSVWSSNSVPARVELIEKLIGVPEIQAALKRPARGKSHTGPRPSPELGPIPK
jgi:hypothetical protein